VTSQKTNICNKQKPSDYTSVITTNTIRLYYCTSYYRVKTMLRIQYYIKGTIKHIYQRINSSTPLNSKFTKYTTGTSMNTVFQH